MEKFFPEKNLFYLSRDFSNYYRIYIDSIRHSLFAEQDVYGPVRFLWRNVYFYGNVFLENSLSQTKTQVLYCGTAALCH